MLAEALAALASTGSTALVTAMVTDGWEGIRPRFARLLGRGNPTQTQAAAHRLEQSRAALTGVPGPALERALAEQQIVWQTRLADLLEEDPGVEDELRAVVAQVAGSVGRVTQHVVASDQAQQAVLGHGVQHVTFGGQRGPAEGTPPGASLGDADDPDADQG
jgi:hypothetical protein